MSKNGTSGTTRLTRVVLHDYRSIKRAEVRLGSLQFFVGRNGAGKSNLLDALSFVAESLRDSLGHALQRRGGIIEVARRRRTPLPDAFGIRLDFDLPTGSGFYAIRVEPRSRGQFVLAREECRVTVDGKTSFFDLLPDRDPLGSMNPMPRAMRRDRLFLVAMSGYEEFRGVYDLLRSLRIYNFDLRTLQTPQATSHGIDVLADDGSNIAHVIESLEQMRRHRVMQYLSRIVPGLQSIDVTSLRDFKVIEFVQKWFGASTNTTAFQARTMSDGTLRALAVLVALFQHGDPEIGLPLIGIEEPETALHPAAAGVLLDAVQHASNDRQILVTSQSPDLLDSKSLDPKALHAVALEDRKTVIASLSKGDMSAIRDHLFTPGELMRMDQLSPDGASIERQEKADLFEPVPTE